MRTERQLNLSFSVLLGLQLATVLAAVTLFGRMAPAIERIIEENVVSIEAVQTMLEAMLQAQVAEARPEARSVFFDALAVARANVTEPAEVPVLERIGPLATSALAGDAETSQQLIEELRALGEINRGAMQVADDAAKRLGVAGAWAMVVLGAAGFVAGLVTLRRLRRRLLVPVLEINAVLRSAASGDRLRRCTAAVAPAGDLAETMSLINRLLDRRLEEEGSTLRDSMVG